MKKSLRNDKNEKTSKITKNISAKSYTINVTTIRNRNIKKWKKGELIHLIFSLHNKKFPRVSRFNFPNKKIMDIINNRWIKTSEQ